MIPVFDGHNDALTNPDHADLANGRSGGHLDLPRMKAGGMRGGIFAVFASTDEDDDFTPLERDDDVIEMEYSPPIGFPEAAAQATAAAGRLLALQRAAHIKVATRVEDLDTAQAQLDGPPIAVLHLEGAEAIDPQLETLDTWYAAGLRSLGPVWSRANAFGYGVPFMSPASPDTGPGLTPAGRRLVKRCAELGVMVDLSHLNEAGFWDVARLEVGPLVASHSGAHALAPCTRNLTDQQLDAIAATGGLVGIVFACAFLRRDFADEADTPLSLIAEHARYVADRIGVEHVALGSDFDGTLIPAELHDVAGLPKLLQALADTGFSQPELEAIAWHNWRRVLAAWWDR
ncbi:MAG TPA: dipeptidase [Solirubrobacteraceae bacterium]|jgi:membrane dipeptidase|nr:dipeptidase [Solirubrobacteraceae bacterium]